MFVVPNFVSYIPLSLQTKDRVLELADLRDRYQAQLIAMLDAEEQQVHHTYTPTNSLTCMHAHTMILHFLTQELMRQEELARYSTADNKHSRQARAWVVKRQERERREARLRIDRIRHDNEMSLVARMAKYGFVR